MRIKKVKVTSTGKINIEYESPVTGKEGKVTYDEMTLVCSAPAAPEFYKALEKLIPDTMTLVEYPKEWKKLIKVTGVSFRYVGKEGTMGALIVAQRELEKSDSPHNFTTPFKVSELIFEEGDSEEEAKYSKKLLPEKCVKLLKEVHSQALGYVEGKRGQTDLFNNEE